MSIQDRVFGKPLATSEERAEHIGVAAGIPIFGLDALTSAAYGPEAAMALLIPLGLLGTTYILPIISTILVLLVIVFFSYRQTIQAYPSGGGSYTVATENLGHGAGLLAAAALMIDYILTAAVGISAGVTALTSAVPGLQPHTLLLCLFILAILTVINLRGVKDTGTAFIIPTFLFIGTLLTLIVVGVYKTYAAGGHPLPVSPIPPALPQTVKYLGYWLMLKAFSSGCAAMTGVEAVSNGVMAFGEPRAKRAQQTLTIIIVILIVLLYGTAWLAKHYGIMAMNPDETGYQSLLSLLVTAVFGRGWFYYTTMGSVLLALALSANTAFADFPRLVRAIAIQDYLPHVFILRGRRLLFSHGVYALTTFTAIILILFKGVTDRLIPLYAIGAFLAFTLSQAGMVIHWKKQEGDHKGRGWHMFVNGIGAVATGITTCIVLASKFMSGAWVTALLIPILILLMLAVKRHYNRIKAEMAECAPINLDNLEQPLVVIPMARWDRITEKALRFGLLMSKEVKVVHIHAEGEGDPGLEHQWDDMIMAPLRAHHMQEPELVTITSSYRFILQPLMEYILELEEQNPGRKVAVLLPELVVRHWWENALHNQRVQLLKLLLLVRGNQRIVVVNIPWYL
ncbi:amino acid/polyamine/organocation transporter, APC superfamily [Granulicella pectinivorans]|jgi:amino acid transporter|uniref:Amino acid/polyamine/organocation transporter, APC superfamily n=1 Tax=Granulicella pectinivorans TaxID=474950 RepID=A0A1I6N089_9BACT|nr:APC family permease [Granulicella pectinivorans]SFS21375.1 amino acid/polyamine/organocation transporter, APC superfamily [Granulicella pectinivorans]